MTAADPIMIATSPMFTSVIVPLDATPSSTRAVPVAAVLAEQMKIPLVLTGTGTSSGEVSRLLDRVGEVASGLTGDVQVEVRRSRAERSGLLAAVARHRRCIVVVATHAARPVSELLLGSMADSLIRDCDRPIVLVGPKISAPDPAVGFGSMLACVDGSANSERLLPLLVGARDGVGLHPTLLEVTADGAASAAVDRLAGRLADEHVDIDRAQLRGTDPALLIARYAATRPGSIIAIATKGRDAFQRLRESSVALAVTRASASPVLVVGPQVVTI